uniref:(northern house mosquito) hypothetical protein n=1 Tax=Culex pipiens TaxID=7175 RepID=A0A8D8KYN9_CULPI
MTVTCSLTLTLFLTLSAWNSLSNSSKSPPLWKMLTLSTESFVMKVAPLSSCSSWRSNRSTMANFFVSDSDDCCFLTGSSSLSDRKSLIHLRFRSALLIDSWSTAASGLKFSAKSFAVTNCSTGFFGGGFSGSFGLTLTLGSC